jgi:polyisoprenoid-binding protein YceI
MAVADGYITVDPAVPSASVTVTMSAASFNTGNRARDRDVRSARFLDSEHHPDIAFRAATLDQREGSWVLAGELEVRGAGQPVTLLIDSVQATEAGLQAHASTRIDRYAFGLTAAKGMAARNLDVELIVAAQPL